MPQDLCPNTNQLCMTKKFHLFVVNYYRKHYLLQDNVDSKSHAFNVNLFVSKSRQKIINKILGIYVRKKLFSSTFSYFHC